MKYIALVAVCFCFGALLSHLIKIIRLGTPKDKSVPSGSVKNGVIYSNTRAMMPDQKESAFLHIPSYAAGMLFHIGVFWSLLCFVLSFFKVITNWIATLSWSWLFAILPAIGTICGLILFVHRVHSKNLKLFSTPDDFISVALVTLFQLMTTLAILFVDINIINTIYYISCILLFVYMPFGKLRHVVYYFAARYHLGFFYGRRNVWPNNENNSK